MKLRDTVSSRAGFEVLVSSRDAQCAIMVLKPGEKSGDYENEHPASEQWLYVISGRGRARVAGRSIALRPKSLLFIKKREKHQIINTGLGPLTTLNFYAPPAYTKSGELRRP